MIGNKLVELTEEQKEAVLTQCIRLPQHCHQKQSDDVETF
jgi:hypothetical protein